MSDRHIVSDFTAAIGFDMEKAEILNIRVTADRDLMLMDIAR